MKNTTPGGYAEIWMVAYPLIITNATQTVMQFVDRKFLSMSSTIDVAAALPGGILAFTLFTFFIVTTGFTAALVAQYNGAGNRMACSEIPWAGFFFAIPAGLLCAWALPLFGNWLIGLGSHPPLVMQRERVYFSILMPAGAFIMINTAFLSFFSGRGRTWVVAGINLAACLLNALLDYMLIFGNWGAPEMGIAGAALGTLLAIVFEAMLAFLVFAFRDQKTYPTWIRRGFRWVQLKKLVKFGTPAGIQVLFSVGAFAFIIFLIGRLGEAELAATTIALAINTITFMPLLGMSEAAGIVFSRHIGGGAIETADRSAYKAWKISACYILFTGTCYLLFPDLLLTFFRPDGAEESAKFAEVVERGRTILAFAAAYNLFNSVRFVFMGALRGAGDTKIPMWIIIGCSWGIMAPGGYLLINVLHTSLNSVWLFMTINSAIVAALIFLRFKSGEWKNIKMTDEDAPRESLLVPPLGEVIDPEQGAT
ncbi:MAG: MATE family efflux transporter [Victivallales bacterium]|nr:MATE family efflux transporter [Victivallales bacterium]